MYEVLYILYSIIRLQELKISKELLVLRDLVASHVLLFKELVNN